MNGAWLVAGLLFLGFLYAYYHLGPRPHSCADAEESPGGGERGPGIHDVQSVPGPPLATPALYSRGGRSGDLPRATGPSGSASRRSGPSHDRRGSVRGGVSATDSALTPYLTGGAR